MPWDVHTRCHNLANIEWTACTVIRSLSTIFLLSFYSPFWRTIHNKHQHTLLHKIKSSLRCDSEGIVRLTTLFVSTLLEFCLSQHYAHVVAYTVDMIIANIVDIWYHDLTPSIVFNQNVLLQTNYTFMRHLTLNPLRWYFIYGFDTERDCTLKSPLQRNPSVTYTTHTHTHMPNLHE